jgi:crossover junction endodeoxyribonuclease RuvC
MILVGIDPGSRKCGYGILHIEKYKIIAAGYGIINLKPTDALEDKLLYLGHELKKLIDEYKPDFSAVEAIFYGKNIQTAFTLGHARGVLIYTLRENNIPVFSYSPREIKQSVTGKGNATKLQVEYMVQSILKLKKPAKEDAADGLACALCLYNKEKYVLLS